MQVFFNICIFMVFFLELVEFCIFCVAQSGLVFRELDDGFYDLLVLLVLPVLQVVGHEGLVVRPGLVQSKGYQPGRVGGPSQQQL